MPGTEQLLSKPVVTAAAAALNQDLAEFDSVSRDLKPETVGIGSTVKVYVGQPTPVFKHANKVPADYNPGQEKVVDIILGSYSTFRDLGTVASTNDLINKQIQITARDVVGMKREIKRDFGFGLMAAANVSFAAKGQSWAGGPSSPISWQDVGQAIELIADAGLAERMSILVPTGAQSSLLGASSTNFWSAKTQDEVFNNRLGEFGGADIIKTNITLRGPTAAQAALLNGASYGPVAEGDNALTLSAATTGVIPAGTMFQFSGVYALDMEGRPIFDPYTGAQLLASFAVPFDVPAGSTVLPLGKSIFISTTPDQTQWGNGNYFSNFGSGIGGGLATISKLPVSGTNAISVTNAGKNVVLAYGDMGFAAISAKPTKIGVWDEFTEEDYGVAVRHAVQGALRGGVTEFRMDAILGFQGVYAPAVCAVIF
jgi:hypothetical protein